MQQLNALALLAMLAFAACSAHQPSAATQHPNPTEKMSTSVFHNFKLKTISGDETIDFAQYKGKKVVILNVASECGYTPQYADWEAFFEKNKANVVVLGFPCNQFGGQEPGTNAEVKTFCQKNYGVTFPMFEKVEVKGAGKSPLYHWLTEKAQNGWNEQEPTWNFCKYVVSEKGELLKFFDSKVKPTDEAFLAALKL